MKPGIHSTTLFSASSVSLPYETSSQTLRLQSACFLSYSHIALDGEPTLPIQAIPEMAIILRQVFRCLMEILAVEGMIVNT